MADFQIPSELEKRLFVSDKKLAKKLVAKLDDFADLLVGDKLDFFVEYTDHSIEHVNKVLENIEDLMTNDTLEKLNSLDSAILIVAVMLHDIGMKATIELFQNMLKGSYDYNQPGMPKEKNIYNDKPWIDLWEDYMKEGQFWNKEKKINIIGESVYTVSRDDLRHKILEDPNGLNGKDKRFIGEFIRRHHGRIAYEVAIRGYWGYNKNRIVLNDVLDEEYLQLAGMVARSHNMGLRENYYYLEKITDKTHYKSPYDIDIILHMVLIRLSDYLHIDEGRTNKIILYLRKTYSPYSLKEHKKHLAITNINFKEKEETISITVKSKIESAELFVGIEQLISDIQSEFDTCWAVLGEQYSDKGYKLKYRRITSNLSQDGESSVRNIQKFVPKQFEFRFNNKLLELLIAPLYGDNPSFGVRELVQNAVDACRTRMALDKEYNAKENFTHVAVSLDPKTEYFRIVDTGVGMNIEEIEKYFLTIGSSYSSSIDWQKTRDDANKENEIYRAGRFGIGILAAFLLGPIIRVSTKRLNSERGYQFTLRLGKNNIQINKVDLSNSGTTIEIKCYTKAFKKLQEEGKLGIKGYTSQMCWFDWYVDAKPKVEYFYGFKPIKTDHIYHHFQDYKPLSSRSKKYIDIHWRPDKLFDHQNMSLINPSLYCNGFLITRRSQKVKFSYSGINLYLPLFWGIPDLKVTDLFNQLPLNLLRDNIKPNIKYDFELELLKSMCKDYLCQLLSIDINSFNKKECLFFHSTGYTFNQFHIFPGKEMFSTSFRIPYTQKCFNGKILVHFRYNYRPVHSLIPIKHFNFHTWDRFIANHSNALFTYNSKYDSSIFNMFDIYIYIKHLNHFSFAITNNDNDTDSSLKEYVKSVKDSLYGLKDKDTVNHHAMTIGDYTVLIDDSCDSSYTDFVNDLVSHCNNLPYEEKPLYFIIHQIEGVDNPSIIDDFINEYAGGNMIVPYDETKRIKKFNKIYKECADEIERYRVYYQEGWSSYYSKYCKRKT